MSVLTNGFHPSFDALSALADLGELEASRTRVSRHVARCAECRAAVAEIRSFGDAVRATEMPSASAGLWSRIRTGLETGAAGSVDEPRAPHPVREGDVDRTPRGTPSPDSDTWRAAPALRPTRHVPSPFRRTMRRGGLALAAAAVIVAVLLVPTSKGDKLQASPSAGTWRFNPARPAPGALVKVRFEPPAGMRRDSALMLLGIPAPSTPGMAEPRGFLWQGLEDSLAMLTRQRDGAYEGRFAVPANFRAMLVRLADAHGRQPHRWITSPDGPIERGMSPMALLVGGTSQGEPSLASLTAALELWGGQRFEHYSVADTLIRYFPGEPFGYAADRRIGPRRVVDDLIEYFQRGERQYLKFDRKYMSQPVVSADHEVGMIAFAHRIDEPGEAAKWTMRLVREHPADPRALALYGAMLSNMLSRNGTVDSVRAALPLADTLWERNGHVMQDVDLSRVSATVHDTVAFRRWGARAFLSGYRSFRGDFMGLDNTVLSLPNVRSAAVPLLRDQAHMRCEMPAGKYSLWYSPERWHASCEYSRASAYASLSSVARLEGRAAESLALADSSLAVFSASNPCAGSEAHQRRGEALLALHDTAAAIPELARGIGYLNWQAERRRDSTAARLGSAVTPERWNGLVQRAADDMKACVAQRNGEEKARRDAELRAEASLVSPALK